MFLRDRGLRASPRDRGQRETRDVAFRIILVGSRRVQGGVVVKKFLRSKFTYLISRRRTNRRGCGAYTHSNDQSDNFSPARARLSLSRARARADYNSVNH